MPHSNGTDDPSRLSFAVTHRSVLAIAIPMTLGYLSTPLLGVVDMAVIGRLGDAALLGGIALGGIIFDLVFTTFSFLRAGTTGLTAQAAGARNDEEIKATLLRALVIALVGGVLVIALQSPIRETGQWFLGGSADVRSVTARYFDIRVLSSPFLLANFAILGWFIGLGRAGTGLLLQLVLNGLNIVLSIWFVMGLGWSVEGVAAATVLSEAAATLLGLFLILTSVRRGTWPKPAIIFNRRLLLRMMALNRDILIRSFALLYAYAFFMARSADQGDTVLAANAVLEKFILVSGYFLDGLATAAEQLAGRAVGAKFRPAFDRTLKLTALWSFAMAGLLSAVFVIFGSALIDFMTTSDEVRALGNTYLIWAVLAPLLGVLAFQMDGIYIGATWSGTMRNMMLLSLAVYIAAYHVLFPLLGNHGLWLALSIFLGLRGVTLLAACRRRADKAFAQV
ncbi:MAG: MATE family efflux transporter [Roseibium album]|uniref:MATE family efflux transporter n=1 Tax=Roseibium album TaxID=311410 RepID=UPI000CF0636D|nr:MATE family multidrug resistance protein [Labrenzia sp. EL_142]MBG6155227.1 MATE family multidrug resistance protein [Labrenzia sp. EL_162]MBG6173793.1 MATE family multidrug resistance protein [Labrenzia sp. EL_132]MBG6192643.1 MATE family multidrug resistance protein [Labrenzia sp. EL_159]MBG6199032.1 MATE family multidrug resistance protein [Labrenzia sp. EL_13]MBG6207020.1 MATE family multidrug resistance protein [Labrenzia sp. EL_126]MBG6228751.1 MATE family multidrug resistance protei